MKAFWLLHTPCFISIIQFLIVGQLQSPNYGAWEHLMSSSPPFYPQQSPLKSSPWLHTIPTAIHNLCFLPPSYTPRKTSKKTYEGTFKSHMRGFLRIISLVPFWSHYSSLMPSTTGRISSRLFLLMTIGTVFLDHKVMTFPLV